MRLFVYAILLASGLSYAETPLKLSDGEIVAIIQAVDQAEVSEAKIALLKSSQSDVRDFSDMIVSDHSGELIQLQDLEKQLPAVDSEISHQWNKDTIETIAKLLSLEGETFDCTYITSQVSIHQRLVDSMPLLPEVKNPTLNSLIQKDEPLGKHHLAEAKKLQASICSGN